MIRVKLIKNNINALERDMNTYFEEIGSIQGVKVTLQDIKLIEAGGPGNLVSMIVTNHTRIRQTES